jgi:hypothetical protein
LLESPTDILKKTWQDREIDGYSLAVGDFKRGRTDRESYFNLFLKRGGGLSAKPVVQGLYFMGRGDYIKPWLEFRYMPRVEFGEGEEVDLENAGLTDRLFSVLAELIPPGGSMMVIYGAEPHPLLKDTEKGLKRNFPPAITPLGHRLWRAGFRWYKDWYFPEGWMEGGMKLQATIPLDDYIRRERERKTLDELEAFGRDFEGRPPTSLERDALSRAEDIMSSLTAST